MNASRLNDKTIVSAGHSPYPFKRANKSVVIAERPTRPNHSPYPEATSPKRRLVSFSNGRHS
jgi:hypothetical protein